MTKAENNIRKCESQKCSYSIKNNIFTAKT